VKTQNRYLEVWQHGKKKAKRCVAVRLIESRGTDAFDLVRI